MLWRHAGFSDQEPAAAVATKTGAPEWKMVNRAVHQNREIERPQARSLCWGGRRPGAWAGEAAGQEPRLGRPQARSLEWGKAPELKMAYRRYAKEGFYCENNGFGKKSVAEKGRNVRNGEIWRCAAIL